MSTAIREEDIILEPCDVYWGRRTVFTITTLADVANSLDETYFDLTANNEVGDPALYRVWLNTGMGTAPAAAGRTLVEVTITTGATAAAVATALVSDLSALSQVKSVSANSNLITLEMLYFGDHLAIADTGTTGFTFAELTEGFGGSLGATNGGVELTLEIGAVDVIADQTGDQILDAIMNANNVTVAMSLQEMTKEKWSLLVGRVSGDEETPMSGTKIVGLGESKRFKNMKQYAGELYLRPVGALNNLRLHTFWKASPTVESINFSGSDIQMAPVSFRCFRDTTKNNKYNIWAFGDVHQ